MHRNKHFIRLNQFFLQSKTHLIITFLDSNVYYLNEVLVPIIKKRYTTLSRQISQEQKLSIPFFW